MCSIGANYFVIQQIIRFHSSFLVGIYDVHDVPCKTGYCAKQFINKLICFTPQCDIDEIRIANDWNNSFACDV